MPAFGDDIVSAVGIDESFQIEQFDRSEKEEPYAHKVIHRYHAGPMPYDQLMDRCIYGHYHHSDDKRCETMFFHVRQL